MEEIKKPWAPTIFLWLGTLVCGAALVRLWPERDYYFLPAARRALHPHYAFLRSSGKAGLTFGAFGTLLLFVNLTYLLRKRLISIAWLGSLRSWMAFHVFTGLVAGAMVLLHSTFLLRSALGTLAFVSMLIVLITGLIGRYIYAHTPRSLIGRELELEEIRLNITDYKNRLEKLGMPHDFFQTALETRVVQGSDKGILATLSAMMTGDRQLRREKKILRQLVFGQPSLRPLAGEILPLAERYCRERQWIARYTELRSLMAGWRFFHRWFAIILLIAVVFHIGVAFLMSNLWLADLYKAIPYHP